MKLFTLAFLVAILITSCNRSYVNTQDRNERLKHLSKELESSENVFTSNSSGLHHEEEIISEEKPSFSLSKTDNSDLKKEIGSQNKLSLKEKLATKILTKKLNKLEKSRAYNPVDTEEEKSSFQMNQKIKIGLILILVGIILGLLVHFIGGLVALVGLVFLILGILEM